MRSEASLVVVRHAVRAVLVVVDAVDIDAEKAISHVSMVLYNLARPKQAISLC